MGDLNIGMAGAVLNNGNLGCKALTYSALAMLEQVSDSFGAKFRYVIFDSNYDEGQTEAARRVLCERIGVPLSRVNAVPEAGWDRLRTPIRHPRLVSRRREMIRALDSLDLVFDLTQGDSFTDMYDDGARMTTFARVRNAAFERDIPVVLGPQTIGPFSTERGKGIARKTLQSAQLVIARDNISHDCAQEVAGIDVPVTTDLAFGLPYEKVNHSAGSVVRVGLNPSGLLVSDARESGLSGDDLSVDYDAFLEHLCNWLDEGGYEVHLIPHVANADYAVCRRIKDGHPRFELHKDFDNPVDAKTLIAQMDLFIGSRMHATIAALSSGVPVVPVAYSRKFEGLFRSLGYGVDVDLRALSTDVALRKTVRFVEGYKDLLPLVNHARREADDLLEETRDILSEYLKTLSQGAK